MTSVSSLVRLLFLSVLLAAGSAAAHEGHDHADAKPSAIANIAPRLEGRSGQIELVAIFRQAELLIYLDTLEGNEPISQAEIEVETPAGPQKALPADGAFRLAAPWVKEEPVDLIFTVTIKGNTEIISGTLNTPGETSNRSAGSWLTPPAARELGLGGGIVALLAAFAAGAAAATLVRRRKVLAVVLLPAFLLVPMHGPLAHEGEDHGDTKKVAQPWGEIAQRLPDGSLYVPKPVQRILAIRTAVAQVSSHRKTLELPGRIIPDPNASGFVQAAVSGRLSPPEGGFPKLGTVVKAGDVLALVTPPFQAIDVSDMRQKAGELDQQIDIVQRRLGRYQTLASSGAVSRVALDEAELELKGLRERRAALERARGEPERLIAPVSGIIASANAVSGQIAETNAVVFQIINPSRLWVEALTFNLLPDGQAATARTSEGRTLSLSFQGAGLTDRSQAIPVHFAVEGREAGLRVGQLVTVLAATGEQVKGLAIPRTSILRGINGQTMLFEHTTAERFEPRLVRVEPLDAERVLVLDGLAAGKRVVVQGAELLNQIR